MAKVSETSMASDANLEAYWEFDNAATDGSGNSNTLTLRNDSGTAPTYDSGVKKEGTHSVKFTRVDWETGNWADCPTSESLEFVGDANWSFWVRFHTAVPSSGYNTYLAKWSSAADGRSWFIWQGNNELHMSITNDDTNGVDNHVDWTPTVDTWYHISINYDASAGSVAFYINGAQQGSTQTGYATSLHVDSVSRVSIGAYDVQDSGGYHYLSAYIDCVAIFSRLLTTAEIAELYNAAFGTINYQLI